MTREAATILYSINQASFFVSHFMHLAQAAQADGYRVAVIAPEGNGVATIRAAGIEFHPLPLDRKGTNVLQELRSIYTLWKTYRQLKPDLIHQFSIKPVLYGGIAARLAGLPAVVDTITGLGFVFIAQGWKARLRRALVKLAYRVAFRQKALRVIFENPDDRQLFVSNGLLAASDSVLIRGAGIDTDAFPCTPELVTEPPLVVLAARMLWDKGVGEYVAAAKRLHEAGVKVRMALVGGVDPGNPQAISAEQLRQWDAEGMVEYWGERQDIAAIFAQCHIVCLPSYREGLPKVLLEAASCGRAIVTTDVTGCREVVRDGHNGLLVPPYQAEPLAQALQRLLEDPALRASMGQHGRQRAIKEFAATYVRQETLAVYRDLLRR